MAPLMHQMAAQSAGHMEDAAMRPGGGRWCARLDKVTYVLKRPPSSASDAGGAALSDDARGTHIKVELSRIQVGRGFAAGVGITRPLDMCITSTHTRRLPPPRRPGFSLGGLPIRDVGGCKAPAFAPPHPRGGGAFRAPPSPPGACPRLKPTPPLPLPGRKNIQNARKLNKN